MNTYSKYIPCVSSINEAKKQADLKSPEYSKILEKLDCMDVN